MITVRPTGGALLWLLLISFCFIFTSANAQDCSALNTCATGCCNKGGYCGIGDDYCGSDCVANCDYEPECSVSKPCASGCCNSYGYCGLGPDCEFLNPLKPSYRVFLEHISDMKFQFVPIRFVWETATVRQSAIPANMVTMRNLPNVH